MELFGRESIEGVLDVKLQGGFSFKGMYEHNTVWKVLTDKEIKAIAFQLGKVKSCLACGQPLKGLEPTLR